MIRQKLFSFLFIVLLSGSIPSCVHETQEEYAEKLKRKNEKYLNYNERRRMRMQARQERTDEWFRRVMGTE